MGVVKLMGVVIIPLHILEIPWIESVIVDKW